MARISLGSPELYINRQASWLAFNRRVLGEAESEANPLLERVKFLAISANNLDEFFEIQVAGLLQRIEDGNLDPGPDGIGAIDERDLIARESHELVEAQYRCWNELLLPQLERNGIRILNPDELDNGAREYIDNYCTQEIDPLLTPITVDPAHPFPRVINKALCLALLLRRRRRSPMTYIGVVTIPRALPRLIRVPSHNHTDDYLFLADLVVRHATSMYRGYDILSTAAFRVTRNSNLYLQEEESRNLLESVRSEVLNRRKGDAVRLEIDAGADAEIIERLRANFELEEWQVYRSQGPVNLPRLFSLYRDTDRPDLKYPPFVPRPLRLGTKSQNLFDDLRRRDVLLHHPYDSYDSVVAFIQAAAVDPQVLSIKQTLYRTSENSPIVRALVEAAAFRDVTVVVEVKARFDEASNIRWARSLEDAGVQVFHGLVGLKTHCKLVLLIRRDDDGAIRRYAHLGTGNYNQETARSYTDLSLLTADPQITAAVDSVFSFLTAYAERSDHKPLLLAPTDLASGLLALIGREAEHAKRRRPAQIIAKMNGLLDKSIIEALYRASQAGVSIELLVRGMCALRPGIKGVSERIRVRSIVGRLLEHSRIFYFANGGEEEIYIGSADWMPRNLYDRVEVVFPLQEPELRDRVRAEILAAYLADTVNSHWLQSDGAYVRHAELPVRLRTQVRAHQKRLLGAAPRDAAFNAQEYLIALAEGRMPAAINRTVAASPEAKQPVAVEVGAPARSQRNAQRNR